MRQLIQVAVVLAIVAMPGAHAGSAASAQPGGGHWSIIARLPVGGNDTAYDYLKVDEAAHRLYVAHGNRVEVLDLPGGQRVGEVAGMHGVHGVEIVPQLGKGYTSDGPDRAVTVFDAQTLAVKSKIGPTGTKPDAIHYDPASKRLYVVNGGDSGNVSVIDTGSDSIVGTVALNGGKLEQIGFDGRGHAFVNDERQSVIHVFDTATLRKTAAWKVAPCEEPTGMAVDAPHQRIFAVCGNHKLVALDSGSGRIVATVGIGADPDGVEFDAANRRLFVSNRDGTLDVISQRGADRYERTQIVATGPGARTIALDRSAQRIYLPTVQSRPATSAGGTASIVPESFAIIVVGIPPAPLIGANGIE